MKNKILQGIVILYAVVAAIDVQMFWFLQPYQLTVELPLKFFGVTNAVMCLVGALAYREAHRFGKKFENTRTLFALAAVLILTCFGLSAFVSRWGLLFFVMEGMAFGLFDPVTSTLLNRVTPSDIRATVLSLRSFASRLFFAFLAPLLGYVADVFSLSQALLLTGIIGMIALALAFALSQTRRGR
jgi:MFS family permease